MHGIDFYSLGTRGAYPDWLRACSGLSGVYVIRERNGRVLYVGESHRGRLRKTITRHFQQWDDSRGTAGPTYDRAGVELAVIPCDDDEAVDLQNYLIAELDPSDNRQKPEELEETPF